MEDISIIYQNTFGIIFIWKRCAIKDLNKINVIFNTTGLHFTVEELVKFKNNIEDALQRPNGCKDCYDNNSYRRILLETPFPQVSFAMNYKDLEMIYDLVSGAFFELNLSHILRKNNIK